MALCEPSLRLQRSDSKLSEACKWSEACGLRYGGRSEACKWSEACDMELGARGEDWYEARTEGCKWIEA